MSFADQRRAYRKGSLSDDAKGLDPLQTLTAWLHEAREAGEPEGTAMALATIDPNGTPAVRYVLCKGVTERGVRFFTNTGSRKGIALAHDPRAAATFWWAGTERAVRLVGWCEPLPRDDVEEYFASRPRGSRLGAWASHQSHPIEGRAALEAQSAAIEARFDDPEPTGAPDEWGGYELVVDELELWQGRDDRLHDRIHFTRVTPDRGEDAADGEPGGDATALGDTGAPRWTAERLQP